MEEVFFTACTQAKADASEVHSQMVVRGGAFRSSHELLCIQRFWELEDLDKKQLWLRR